MKKHTIVTSDNLPDFQGWVESYLNDGWTVAHLSCGVDSIHYDLTEPLNGGVYNNAFIAILERPND